MRFIFSIGFVICVLAAFVVGWIKEPESHPHDVNPFKDDDWQV